MIRTRAGYSGGSKLNPTYHSLGDHTESLQVDFDPARVSYEQLLAVFWASHDPFQAPWDTQYKAALFYADEEQRRLAQLSRDAIQSQSGRGVRTEILPLTAFYRAEDYHQKYYLRQRPELWADAASRFGDDARALTDSTLAARLNGYAGRFGSAALLREELPSYGLSEAAGSYLLRLAPALHTGAAIGGCQLP